jgi:hypothetical protein
MLFPLFLAGAGYGALKTKEMSMAQKSPTTEVLKVAAWTVPFQIVRIYANNIQKTFLKNEVALAYGLFGAPLTSLYAMGVGRQTAIMAATFWYAYNNTHSLNSKQETMV